MASLIDILKTLGHHTSGIPRGQVLPVSTAFLVARHLWRVSSITIRVILLGLASWTVAFPWAIIYGNEKVSQVTIVISILISILLSPVCAISIISKGQHRGMAGSLLFFHLTIFGGQCPRDNSPISGIATSDSPCHTIRHLCNPEHTSDDAPSNAFRL
jgi:hypothetical protein